MVAKAYPDEKGGVFARRGGQTEVVEYSELDPSEAAATFDGKSPPPHVMAAVCCLII